MPSHDSGFFSALLKDGRPLLSFTGLCLVLSGMFAVFLSMVGQFLPHDVQFLGMTPEDLCAIHECRIVHFMIHDRASFGGALLAVGLLYLWLVEFPLRRRQAWAWWALAASGLWGFASFLAYLGYGYLDSWHGVGTLFLLPCFGVGLARSFPTLEPFAGFGFPTPLDLGRISLLVTAGGLIGAGAVITVLGATTVLVPQDVTYLGLSPAHLHAINPRLLPLIAHDRAGFGGAVCTAGILVFFCAWFGQPSRSLLQVLWLAGLSGFVPAIGVHPMIGYNDIVHLAPAVSGSVLFTVGLILWSVPLRWKRPDFSVVMKSAPSTAVPSMSTACPASS
jgi:hypothetical protein